jgi:hypothetical protein
MIEDLLRKVVLWTDYKQVENYKTRQALLIHQLVTICWRVVPHTISFYNPEPYYSQNILGHDIVKSIPSIPSIPKYPKPWYCQKYPKISYDMTVATPLWPSVGVKPNIWKSWRLGVFRDSRMFRARQQGAKHLVLGCSWCHWKGIET